MLKQIREKKPVGKMRKSLFCILVFTNIIVLRADDFEKFKKAFSYITKDTVSLNNWFKESLSYDTLPVINVSKEVVYISVFPFMDSIIAYEIKNIKSKKIDILFKDSLMKARDSINKFKSFIDYRLLLLNEADSPKFMIYFSKIEKGGKLKAEIMPYEGVDEYRKTWLMGHRSLFYLFYFKKNKIVKVFRSEAFIN